MNQKTRMPDKPNVIWILPDQMRAQALSCNGDPNVQTPNIDALAARGINFRQARSGFPLCCPARGSILTGLYPNKCTPGHDMGLPPDQKTIAHVMKESGYKTAYFGKWHLDAEGNEEKLLPKRGVFHLIPPERRGGFETFRGYQINNEPWDCYVNDESDNMQRLQGFETDALTDLLINYMEDASDPFFAVLSVFSPHNPYLAPEEYLRDKNPARIELRKNVPDVEWVQQQARRELPGYYAAIENMDYNVGKIIKALDRAGIADNTYIVFFSDHGDMHGSHGQFRKTTPYEEAVRVPLIISTGHGCLYSTSQEILYGTNGAGICDALVNHVDIAPTTLGLCNIPVPDWMQGFDYADYVKGGVPENEPESVFLQCNIPTMHHNSIGKAWRGIVTKNRWKYVALENHEWLLFNLKEDPYEVMNMAHIVDYMPVMHELNAALKAWIDKAGDSFPLPEIYPPQFRIDNAFTNLFQHGPNK